MNRLAFGQRLKFLRRLEGVTQARLAEAVDVTVEHLSNVERGVSSPSFELIMRLAEALRTEPANLFLFAPFRLGEPEEDDSPRDLNGLDWRRYVTHMGSYVRHLEEGRSEWSHGLYRLLGYRPGEIRPGLDAFRSHVHPEDLPSLDDFNHRLLDGLPAHDFTLRLRRKDGTPRLAVTRAEVDRAPDGRPLRLVGLILDITEQKRFEQSLVATHQKMEQRVRERTAALRRAVRRLEREVAERRRAEARLTETSERLRLVLETMTDGYWDMNLGTGEAYHSPSWELMLGYDPGGLNPSHETFLAMVHPEDRGRLKGEISLSLREHPGERFENEFRLLGRDHRWRWVLSRGRVLEWSEDGTPLRLAGVHTNITAIREAELALRVNERRLQQAQRMAALGSWEWTPGREPSWWSDNLYRLLGYAPGQVAPSNELFLRHVHPEDRRIVADLGHGLPPAGAPFTLEYRIVRTDGAVRHILATGVPLAEDEKHGEDKKTGQAYAGTIQDVTEQRQAEAALAESEARLRLTFDLAPVSVALVAPDGRFLRVNRELCAFTGYSEDELATRTFMDLTHPDDLEADTLRAEAVLRGDIDHYQMRKRYVRKDGDITWGLLTVRLVRDAEGRPAYFLSIVLDVNDRVTLEREHGRERERFHGVFDRDPRPRAVLDSGGRVLRANRAFAACLGRKAEALVGAELPGLDRAVLAVVADGERETADLTLAADHGARVAVRLRRVPDDQGRTLCLLADIPESRPGDAANETPD
ncbi:MAG: PAS domain-containing protein [Desulfovibrionaceae bacterium]